MRLEKRLTGKNIRSPFFTVSGVYSCRVETVRRLADDVPGLGGITTKSIGLNPRDGNREPVLAEYEPGSYVNAVGLSNPGVEEFEKELKEILPLPGGVYLLVSLFADGALDDFEKEFAELAGRLGPLCDGLELNLSCPHVAAGGALIGRNPENVEKAVKAVKKTTGKPVFVKLSPNFGNIGELAAAAEKSGADGIAAINTVGPGLALDPFFGEPILSNKLGGMSGAGIWPFGAACVREITARTNIPVIAMGGIQGATQVKAYRQAGAGFFGIGSALAGMSIKKVKDYLETLKHDLERNADNARFMVNKGLMKYEMFHVEHIEFPSPRLALMKADKPLPSDPGQFAFILLPGEPATEKPYSVALDDPFTLLVRLIEHPSGKKGPFTERFFNLKPGDPFLVRGPYGKSVALNSQKRSILVAGGTGAAPLYFAYKRYRRNSGSERPLLFFYGTGGKSELALAEVLENLEGCDFFPATEDGTAGYCGNVVDCLLEHISASENPDMEIIACGPEKMLKALVDKIEPFIPLKNIRLILEPYMKCGVGVCGSCSLEDGRLACVDTHIVTAAEAKRWKRFGKFKSSRSGNLREI